MLRQQAENCKKASRQLAWLATGRKDRILLNLAAQLRQRTEELLNANAQDCEAGQQAGLSEALLDRLRLTPAQTLRASGWKAMRPAPSTRLTAVVSILAVYGATSCPMAASAVRPKRQCIRMLGMDI